MRPSLRPPPSFILPYLPISPGARSWADALVYPGLRHLVARAPQQTTGRENQAVRAERGRMEVLEMAGASTLFRV
jgi:hypothetical protein